MGRLKLFKNAFKPTIAEDVTSFKNYPGWILGYMVRYFNGYSDTRLVQENFSQEAADKHIPSKTSRSVSSVPWMTPEIRRKIRRKNATHAKAKKSGSEKIRSKFESLRRKIKADITKQHDLYVNNLVGDVKANPRDFYRYINSQKKRYRSKEIRTDTLCACYIVNS